jgi:hypothetical protein
MKWVKERDLLIAQTMAFVQSVTGKKPDFTATPYAPRALPVENALPVADPAPVAPSLTKIQPIESATPTEFSPPELPLSDLSRPQTDAAPPIRAFSHSDVRQEIQSRVAAFQAHQHRFQREREAYFKSVFSKVRSDIENGPETPPT